MIARSRELRANVNHRLSHVTFEGLVFVPRVVLLLALQSISPLFEGNRWFLTSRIKGALKCVFIEVKRSFHFRA